MAVVRAKEGCQFTIIAPAGFRILAAIDHAAAKCEIDLTITSACDGMHSGVDDPHHRGEAFDVRSHNLTQNQKRLLLTTIMSELGYERFYGFLEAADSDNEHFHFQIKKGTTYP